MPNYFYKLLQFPTLPEFIVKEAIGAEYNLTLKPNLYKCDTSSFNQTNFFKSTQQHFGRKCFTRYYLTHPNSYYGWHVDSNRQFAMNWVVKDTPCSFCFFKEPIVEAINPDFHPLFHNLIQVDYDLYKPTIINTSLEHCVINNYNDRRIILTMTVPDVSFEEGVEYFSKLHLDSY
jgi:hypothetical protein